LYDAHNVLHRHLLLPKAEDLIVVQTIFLRSPFGKPSKRTFFCQKIKIQKKISNNLLNLKNHEHTKICNQCFTRRSRRY